MQTAGLMNWLKIAENDTLCGPSKAFHGLWEDVEAQGSTLDFLFNEQIPDRPGLIVEEQIFELGREVGRCIDLVSHDRAGTAQVRVGCVKLIGRPACGKGTKRE